jgi:hypothetical protein
MLDGAELGTALAAHPDDVEAALAEYEQKMFPRSADGVAEGIDIYERMFGDDAPHAMVRLFTGAEQAS